MNRSTLMVAMGILVSAMLAQASITIDTPRTFDTGTDGWTSDNLNVTLSNPASGSPSPGGNPGGYLGINFDYDGPGGPPAPLDPVLANVSSAYIGSYLSADGLVFDFMAFDQAPSVGSAILLTTSAGDTWTHAFSYLASQVGTWVTFVIPLVESSWVGGTAGDFANQLSNVTGVALDIEGNVGVGGLQRFGVDNWTYVIPEPRTYAMLGAALLGLAMTFRRPLQDALENMKKPRNDRIA